MLYDIFIGYSRTDSAPAAEIQEALLKAGLRCYRDVTHIAGTEDWRAAITQAIRECYIYLPILSKEGLVSEHVAREMSIALSFKKYFMPVLLTRNAVIPDAVLYYIGGLQYIYAEPLFDSALREITSTALRIVDRPRNNIAYEAEVDVKSRANLIHSAEFTSDTLGLPIGENGPYKAHVDKGAWIVANDRTGYWGHHLNRFPRIAEFVAEVRLEKFEGDDENWFGLEYGDSYPNDYYQFALNGNRGVKFAQRQSNAWVEGPRRELMPAAEGGNGINILKVVRREEMIHIFVNGLHALNVRDFNVRTGSLGFLFGPGMRIGCSNLQIHGVDPADLLLKAKEHWNRLEMKEAKGLLGYVSRFVADDDGRRADELLAQSWPDRRETVLIAIGAAMDPQLNDRAAAEKLRQRINLSGKNDGFRWSAIVTDSSLLNEQKFLECPLVSVGGPLANKLTDTLQHRLPTDPRCQGGVKVQHNVSGGERHIAVWGQTGKDTANAVDFFISSGILDTYLRLLWNIESAQVGSH